MEGQSEELLLCREIEEGLRRGREAGLSWEGASWRRESAA